jgi:hypothetical protein
LSFGHEQDSISVPMCLAQPRLERHVGGATRGGWPGCLRVARHAPVTLCGSQGVESQAAVRYSPTSTVPHQRGTHRLRAGKVKVHCWRNSRHSLHEGPSPPTDSRMSSHLSLRLSSTSASKGVSSGRFRTACIPTIHQSRHRPRSHDSHHTPWTTSSCSTAPHHRRAILLPCLTGIRSGRMRSKTEPNKGICLRPVEGRLSDKPVRRVKSVGHRRKGSGPLF